MNYELRTMNRTTLVQSMILFVICCALPLSVDAQVPHLIRYQGQAVDSKGVPLEGPYTLIFRFYDAGTGGTKLWEETQVNVPLKNGYFSVLLGQVTPLTSMDWGKACWLSIQVNTQPELTPRQQITSVPLAMMAERLDGPMTMVGVNVGIGTTSPTSVNGVVGLNGPLHIAKTGDAQLIIDGTTSGTLLLNDSGAAVNSRIFQLLSDGGDFTLRSLNDGTTLKATILTAQSTGNVGIGTATPSNILTIQQGSLTDPIADSWTVYPSDRKHKEILRTVRPRGYLQQIKTTEFYEWKRTVAVSDEEAQRVIWSDDPSKKVPSSVAEVEIKKQQLLLKKAMLPKYTAKRIGMVIDDANVPVEVLTFSEDGTKTGIDLLAYIGYLHAGLKEAALKIDELESRLPPTKKP